MPLRVSNLRLPVDEPEQVLRSRVARALGLAPADIAAWRILRKSLDARDKDELAFVYALEVCLPEGERRLVERAAVRRSGVQVELYRQPPFEPPTPGDAPLDERPVIVGAGPAGLVAGYFLAVAGYRPIVLERGQAVRQRIRDVASFDAGGPHDPESNYLFGEGGAGTFSDGKLTCRVSGADVRRVLELFAECKGKPSILYDYRPHLGSNRLPAVVKALRQRIEAAGGELRFGCRVEDIVVRGGRVQQVVTSGGPIDTSILVVAVGHSARDTTAMLLARGVPIVPKPFQIGVRIEQPQEQVNRLQYGPRRLEESLGAADYSVTAKGPHNLFSFCMCAGGHVMPSISEPGYFCTNGMSLSGRDSPFANSGLMITLEPADFGSADPLAGIAVQREFERLAFAAGGGEYRCPIQWVGDFLAGRTTTAAPPSSYARGVAPTSIAELVPRAVVAALMHGLPAIDRRWNGRFLAQATLVGPESRGSSPVRFIRDEATLESPGIAGLYPVGEGAGYAGGIVSAAVDGLRAARAIIERFAPLVR